MSKQVAFFTQKLQMYGNGGHQFVDTRPLYTYVVLVHYIHIDFF